MSKTAFLNPYHTGPSSTSLPKTPPAKTRLTAGHHVDRLGRYRAGITLMTRSAPPASSASSSESESLLLSSSSSSSTSSSSLLVPEVRVEFASPEATASRCSRRLCFRCAFSRRAFSIAFSSSSSATLRGCRAQAKCLRARLGQSFREGSTRPVIGEVRWPRVSQASIEARS